MPAAVARMVEAGYAHGRPAGAGVTLALKDSIQPRVAGRGSENNERLLWERDQACQHAAAAAEGSRARAFFNFIAQSADLALAAHAT